MPDVVLSCGVRFLSSPHLQRPDWRFFVTSNFASSNFRKSDSSDFRKSKSPLFKKNLSDLEHVKLKTEGNEYKLKKSLYVVQS